MTFCLTQTRQQRDCSIFILNQSVYAHSSFLSDTPQMGRSFTGGVNVKF
ncbi:TPA: hypothetical protein ACU8BU_001181 [Neisseria subflava]